ncbi:hypothetical protein E8E14_001052 [Neopestalotiopsis sp. 37M]|nr:hypothetical protein E8E14_001052 [Neopestalotiopsis sp. 37M]
MKSSMIRSAVAALAFCSNTVFGAQTAEQIVASLNTLTDKSQDLQAPAETITAVNGALIVVGQGPFPKIISGFQEIVTLATNDISQMQGTETITDAAEADNVYAAFRDFSAIHQKLLTTLTGKAALLSTVPIIAAPMSAILRQDENVLDVCKLS